MKNYIAEWRRERGLSLEQLAERTGLSKGTISRIENGARDPSVATLEKLAFALSCEPGALLRSAPRPMPASHLRLVH